MYSNSVTNNAMQYVLQKVKYGKLHFQYIIHMKKTVTVVYIIKE